MLANITEHAVLRLKHLDANRNDCIPDGEMNPHLLPWTVIALSLQGSYEIDYFGQKVFIKPGEGLIVGANIHFDIVYHGDPHHDGFMKTKYLHLYFTLLETIDVTSLLNMPLRFGGKYFDIFSTIIDDAIALYRSTPVSAAQTCERIIRQNELAFRALQTIYEISDFRDSSTELFSQLERLAPAFAFIRQNLHQTISVKQLARLLHLSTSAVHALFKKYLAQPPIEYIRNLRLSKAGKMLLATDRPIYEIAAQIGYSNQFHFTRAFKSHFNMTPTQFRQKQNPLIHLRSGLGDLYHHF